MEGVRQRQIFELGALRKPGQGIHDVLCLQEKVHPSERCAHGVTISSVSDVLCPTVASPHKFHGQSQMLPSIN